MNDLGIILSGFKRDLDMLVKAVALINKTQSQRLKESWNNKKLSAQILGCSLRTINNLTSSGKLPISKINRLVFIKTSDIERLLNENYDKHSTDNNSTFKTKSHV